MKNNSLTPRQQVLLDFLQSEYKSKGSIPTYREIMEALGYSSTNSVAQIVTALEKKGWVRRDGGSIVFEQNELFLTESELVELQTMFGELLTSLVQLHVEKGVEKTTAHRLKSDYIERLHRIID